METKNKIDDIRLPEGYDIINDYQENTEQAVVDNLFDYFGHVYYKNHGDKTRIKARNHYISKHDLNLFRLIDKKIIKFGILSAIFIILGVIGYILYYFLIGGTFQEVSQKAADLGLNSVNGWDQKQWDILFVALFSVICIISFIGIVLFGFALYWILIKSTESKRVNNKIRDWNEVFYNFSHNLTKSGIQNAIQAAIPNLVLDKHTPAYDRKTYNLHSRIYSYGEIPRDAKKIDFKNVVSGFYKGSPWSISYSAWEWFREAKIVDQRKDAEGHRVFVNVKRSLRRFEDRINVLTVDTFAESKLNFVLNNPDGKNIRLQNKIFNNIFSLAVNNPKLAYTVFTPYVQHTLSRCKTWTDSCRQIRQVIKEGSKIYVVFDGKENFFNFDRITNPELNHIFNSRHEYTNVVVGGDRRLYGKQKRFAIGSLDESASLMTEYILEELDILFSVLEMATCYPLDDALVAKEKNKRSLYDVLEEKRNDIDSLKYKTIQDLEDRFNKIPHANVDLSQPWQPQFKGNKINLQGPKPFNVDQQASK